MRKQYEFKKYNGLGRADYFDDRHKYKMLELAGTNENDVFIDLGCGDASVLIFAVKEFNVKKAVGYEADYNRFKKAAKNVMSSNYADRIILKHKNFLRLEPEELNEADIIFNMHIEYKDDLPRLHSKITKPFVRIIKHDLPIIGFIPDMIDYPFYVHITPLRRAKNKIEWISSVFQNRFKTLDENSVWRELYYYRFQKGYIQSDITRFKKMLDERVGN